ncbi:hypothetical protein GCM10023346_00310 [Arthrobacter gyeryongensis]|uniref:Uncharacterized protein n=1 Tax=Arthrobacter gyeryongensis TaxID=1650592 RepID=A0ABP9RY84_9MICC
MGVRTLEFSKSAGVFLSGIIFIVGGSVLSWAFSYFAGVLVSRNSDPQLFVILAYCALGLVLLGFIQLVVAAYRALVKIDALHVPAPRAAESEWHR